MTDRTMYDSASWRSIPADPAEGTIIAVYRNGRYAADPAEVEARFPAAKYVVIWVDVNGTDPETAQALDVERYDAAPADAPGWIRARLAAVKGSLPTIYCDRSTIDAVTAACGAAGLKLGVHWWFWVSTLDGTRYEADGVVACQYQGGVDAPYDVSDVYADWWHCLPAPRPVLVTQAQAEAEAAAIVAAAARLMVYARQG